MMAENDTVRIRLHDINNSLGAVVLNLEVALAELEDASPARESLQDALQASREVRDHLAALRALVVAKF